MSELERMFNLSRTNTEDFAADETADAIASMLLGFSKEVKLEGRVFTGYDVADMLDNAIIPSQTDELTAKVQALLADVIRQAQYRKSSVDAQLEQVLLSGVHPMQKKTLQILREQPQLFDWIKLNSV